MATVRSPVAAFESESPSVRRKDVEDAIFLDPLLYPKIVFYRMVSMFLPFFGHVLERHSYVATEKAGSE